MWVQLNLLPSASGGENPQLAHFLRPGALVEGFQPAPGLCNWEADRSQRWVLQAARQRGVNIVHAFSNSPPYWMTVSGSVTGAKGGGNNLRDDMYEPFADYLAKVVAHFATSSERSSAADPGFGNLLFDAVTPLNEPVSSWWKYGNDQEGCHFDRNKEAEILLLLRKALDARNMQQVRVSGPEENSLDDTLTSLKSYNDTVLAAMGLATTHTYNGVNRKGLAAFAKDHGLELWNSEYGSGSNPLQGGMAVAQRICQDMNELEPTVWTLWQAADLNNPVTPDGWGLLSVSYPPENLYFFATNSDGRDDSLCLATSASGNGSPVYVENCNRSSIEQVFSVVDAQIRARNASGLCLDDWGQSMRIGDDVRLYSCWGGANQQWNLTLDGRIHVNNGSSAACLGFNATARLVKVVDCTSAPSWNVTATFDVDRFGNDRSHGIRAETSSSLVQQGLSRHQGLYSRRLLSLMTPAFEPNVLVRKQYYAYMQFTRWIRPGCSILQLDQDLEKNNELLFARCPQSIVVVSVNADSSSRQQTLKVSDGAQLKGSCSAFVTDDSNNATASADACSVDVGSNQVTVSQDGVSILTVVIPTASKPSKDIMPHRSRNSTPLSVEGTQKYTYMFKCNATYPYVHNAMLEVVSENVVLGAFQAGTGEGAEGQVVMLSRSNDSGKTWSEPWAPLLDRRGPAQWAPILHMDAASSSLFMWYVQDWAVFQTKSSDLGRTWSTPRGIFAASFLLPVPKEMYTANKLVVDNHGTWILPLDTCSPASALVLYSNNGGQSWTWSGNNATAPGTFLEPAVAAVAAGPGQRSRLLMTLRTTTGAAYQSYSTDAGVTWTWAKSNGVPACDSKTCLWVPSGSNSTTTYLTVNVENRTRLVIFVSQDSGASWQQLYVVEDGADGVNHCYPTTVSLVSSKTGGFVSTNSADDTVLLTAYTVYKSGSDMRTGIRVNWATVSGSGTGSGRRMDWIE